MTIPMSVDRSLFNTAPCGLLSFGDDGLITMANATLHELLERSEAPLSGQPLISILSAASRIFYQTHFFPLLKLQGQVEEIYLSLKTKSGGDLPVLVNGARRERDGTVFNDCALIPIRQRIQFEEKLLQARKMAEDATRAKNLTTIKLEQAHADLEIKQSELLELNARLEILATTDPLTGLKNRRVFQETLFEKMSLRSRYSAPLSLLLIDIDHFKRINDLFSHLVGDQVLQAIARILLETVRTTDVVTRYGGEEFAIILTATDFEGSIEIAERLRRNVEAAADFGVGVVTMSVGVATMGPDYDGENTLLADADRAMYCSKANGRNCVTHARDMIEK